MSIEAIIFDNDGVLVDSEILIKEAQKKAFNEAGYNVDHKWLYANTQGLNWTNIAKNLETDFGVKPNDDIPNKVYEFFNDSLSGLNAVKNISQTLDELSLPYAIATSGSSKLTDKKLITTELKSKFKPNCIVTSDNKEVVNGKPAPDIFLCAAKTMEIEPENCLVVEDSCSGVVGGKKANMYVVGFTGASHSKYVENHKEKLLNAGADIVISDISELHKIIKNINNA